MKKLIKSNFYEAVNKEWLEKTEIPSDLPAASAFMELHVGIEKTLMDLTKKWASNPNELNDSLKQFIKWYQMTNDFDKRESLGTKPYDSIKNRINSINSLSDLEEVSKSFILESIDMPFGFSVEQDFMNSNNQVLFFGATDLFLPSKDYYLDEEKKNQLLGLFTASTKQLLTLYGYSNEESDQLLKEALQFDELLVPVTKSSVEKADYVKLYNPFTKDEIINLTNNFDLIGCTEKVVGQPVDKLIVMNPDFINSFDTIISEQNFQIIKSWMIVSNVIKFSSSLTDEIRIAGGAFGRALSGIKEAQNKEKFAFYQAYNPFNQVVGMYYGENYFGPAAKADVKNMVHEMIGVYKERITSNTWLQEETKSQAVKKLDNLSVHVGYPDEIPTYYDSIKIDGYAAGSDLIKERLEMKKVVNAYNFAKFNKKPNRNIWAMPASMVNAYYNPMNNQIVFPAAILQEPYYSLNQSPSENYGGIGAVMAHEITHAFDNNGAKFDEYGSLKNWWTKEDLDAFDKKAEDMIGLFDGLETGFGKCNGKLTVSENIADSGGIRCALEASAKNDNHSPDEFFRNWARVWRVKASEQYSQLLLNVDVHGPAILRANMQLSNLPEFQDFYNLEEQDKMYLSKDKMVSIW